MKLKSARVMFVCAFTALFTCIAFMGEGLHILPGIGHSCDDAPECIASAMMHTGNDGYDAHHSSAVTHADQNTHGKNSAADCAVCKYFSQAKPYQAAYSIDFQYTPISEILEVFSCLLESRFAGSYQSRAPPPALFHV